MGPLHNRHSRNFSRISRVFYLSSKSLASKIKKSPDFGIFMSKYRQMNPFLRVKPNRPNEFSLKIPECFTRKKGFICLYFDMNLEHPLFHAGFLMNFTRKKGFICLYFDRDKIVTKKTLEFRTWWNSFVAYRGH